MTQFDVQKIIDVAKADFEKDMMVAFLGDMASGKTVNCALIKDTVTQYLEERTNGEYYGTATDGSDRMNQLIKKLYTGTFPVKTYVDQATPMTIDIHSKSGSGGVMKIILRDMAGEKGEDLLQQEMDVNERLKKIFKMSPIEGKPYGLLTHLVFAKIYIILIDCSKYRDWPFKQAYVKDTIRHLHDIKKRIGEITNNRITAPIAIVFSKYDTLAKTKQKPAKELMKELKEIKTALNIYHDGNVECFLSKVDSTPLTKEQIDTEVKRVYEEKNEEKKKAENDVKDIAPEKEDAKNTLDQAKEKVNEVQGKLDQVNPTKDPNQINPVQEELDTAQEKLEEAEQEYAEATSALDNARKTLNEINKKIKEGPNPPPEKLGVSIYKPNRPLSYSKDDYLDLIMWLIKKHKQIRGY